MSWWLEELAWVCNLVLSLECLVLVADCRFFKTWSLCAITRVMQCRALLTEFLLQQSYNPKVFSNHKNETTKKIAAATSIYSRPCILFQIIIISNSRSETLLQFLTFLSTRQLVKIVVTKMRHRRVRQQIYPMMLSCKFNVAKIS